MATTGILTIDLMSIVDNWHFLSKQIGNTARCASVVKTNAYGLGVEPVSKALLSAGCKTFFVTTVGEAKQLRSWTPDPCEIIVLGGLSHDDTVEGCLSDWADFSLIPVLFTIEHIARWSAFCASQECILPSVVKVDTGMHRLGLSPSEIEGLLDANMLQSVHPIYLISHFACADQPAHPLNQQQIDTFTDCAIKVKQHIPNIALSLANSSGIFLGEQAHFDLSRPGAALYGIKPTLEEDNPMRPVVQLQLPVMQLKTIAVGESVGYGAEFTAQRTTRLAIVFGGYGDGLFRCLDNAGFAYCCGQKVPVVGRVSMDSMVFDVTDVAEESLQYVDIIGADQSLDEFAQQAGTIAYEVLTNLGDRYQRRYINMPTELGVMNE